MKSLPHSLEHIDIADVTIRQGRQLKRTFYTLVYTDESKSVACDIVSALCTMLPFSMYVVEFEIPFWHMLKPREDY